MRSIFNIYWLTFAVTSCAGSATPSVVAFSPTVKPYNRLNHPKSITHNGKSTRVTVTGAFYPHHKVSALTLSAIEDGKNRGMQVSSQNNGGSDESLEQEKVIAQAIGSILFIVISYFLLMTILNTASSVASATFSFMGEEIANEMTNVLHFLVGLISAVVNLLANTVKVVAPALGSAAVSGYKAAAPIVSDASKAAADAASPYVEEATKQISTAAAPYIDSIGTAVDSTVVSPIRTAAESMAESVGTTIDTTVFSPLKDAAGTVADSLSTAVDSSVVTPLKDVTDSTTNAIDSTIVTPIKDAVVAPVVDAADSISDTVDSSIMSPIKGAAGSITDALDAVKNALSF